MNYLKAIQEKQIEIDALINELDEVERLKSEAETAYVNKTMIDGADTTVELAKSEALMSKAIELCGAINAMRNEQEALIRESIDEGNRAPEPLTDKDIRDVESQLCIETARKFAAYFNLPGAIETKSDIVALVCKICELKYGTDYLSKSRHKAAIDGRAYIAWILRTFFEFTFSEIGAILNKDHSTIIHIYQKFDGFVGISRYPEYKLAAALRKALVE